MGRRSERAGTALTGVDSLVCALGASLAFVGAVLLVLAYALPGSLGGVLSPQGVEQPIVPICLLALGGCVALLGLRDRQPAATWALGLAAGVVLALSVAQLASVPAVSPLSGAWSLASPSGAVFGVLANGALWIAVGAALVLASLATGKGARAGTAALAVAVVAFESVLAVAAVLGGGASGASPVPSLAISLSAVVVATGALCLALEQDSRPIVLLSCTFPLAPLAALAIVGSGANVQPGIAVASSVVLFVVVLSVAARSQRSIASRAEAAFEGRAEFLDRRQTACEQAGGFGTWHFQLGTEEVEVSEKAAELLGAPTARIVERSNMVVGLHEDDAEVFSQWLSEVVESDGPVCRTVRRLASARETRWLELCGVAKEATGSVYGTVRDVSPTVEARHSLEETVSLLQSVAQTVPDVDFVYDLWTFEYVYMNHSLSDLFKAAGPVSGSFIEDHVHPQDKAAFLTHAQTVNRCKDDSVHEVEYRVLRDDGSVAWFKSRASVFKRAPDGTPVRVFGTVQDVTDYHKTLQLLREATERFERVSSQSPGAIYRYVLSPEGKPSIPYISDAAEALFGVSSAEIMEDPAKAFSLVHPEDADGLHSAIEHSRRSLSDFFWVGRMVQHDGRTRWVQASSRPSRLEDGSTAWDGVAMDVTSVKEAQEAYERAGRRMQHLLAQSPTVVYECSSEPPYVLTTVASNVRSLLGLYPEQVVGRSLFSTGLVHQDDEAKLSSHERRFVDHGSSTAEFRLRTVSGDYVWVRDDVRIVSHESGLSDVIGAWTDITAQVEALEAMRAGEDRYRRMASSVPGMAFELRLHSDGTPEFVFVGRGCYEVTGLTPEEVVSRPESFLRLIDQEDKLRLYRELVRSQLGLGRVEWEGTVTLESGAERTLALVASTPDVGGGDAVWTGHIRDVTESKVAGRRLAVADALIADLLAKTSDAVITADAEGRITAANANVAGLFGYAPAELIGKSVAMLVPEESREAHERLIEGFSASSPSNVVGKRREVIALTKGGGLVPVTATVLLADRPDGTRFVGLFHRLSPKKVPEPVAAVTLPEPEPEPEPPRQQRVAFRPHLLVIASEGEAKRLLLDDPEVWGGFAVTIATSVGLGLELAKRRNPDVMLFVHEGPVAMVRGVLEAVRADDDLSRLPVVVLDRTSAGTALEKLGATRVLSAVEPGQRLSDLLEELVVGRRD